MAHQRPEKRREERFERWREELNESAEDSIPQGCGSVHETKAAYRLLGVPSE